MNQFITLFVTIFLAIVVGASATIFLPLLLLSFFTVSKSLLGVLFLAVTVVATTIALFVVRREYDMSDIPSFQGSIQLVGIIALFPLLSYGPAMFIGRTPDAKDLSFIFAVTIWLLVIGCVTYLILKFSK